MADERCYVDPSLIEWEEDDIPGYAVVVQRALERKYTPETRFVIESRVSPNSSEQSREIRVDGFHGLTGGFRVEFVSTGQTTDQLSWTVTRASRAAGLAWAFGMLVGGIVMCTMLITVDSTPGFVDVLVGFLCMFPSCAVGWLAIRILAPLLGLGGRKVPDEELRSILAITNASLASGEPTLP